MVPPLYVLERLLLLMTFYVKIRASYYSPVYVWGAHCTEMPSLTATESYYFGTKMTPLLKNHCIVAFVEKNLTQNDFLCTQAATRQPCFEYMKQYTPATYINLVEDPIQALQAISQQKLNIWINSTGQKTYPIDCTPGVINFIYFNDTVRMERNQRLIHHDKMISSINCDMKYGNKSAVYIYMSKENPERIKLMDTIHKRERRNASKSESSAPTNSSNNTFFFASKEFVLEFAKLELKFNNNTVKNLSVSNMNCTTSNILLSVVLMTTNSSKIIFNISLIQNYNIVSSIEYNKCKIHPFLFEIPSQFSYLCKSLKVKCKDFVITFDSVQFEVLYRLKNPPTKKPKSREDFHFKPPWNCVGFVTPAIASGVFVIIFIVSITLCGINWIANISGCDLYDDPTKPTITIPIIGH